MSTHLPSFFVGDADNPWLSLDYLYSSWPALLAATGEHLRITLATVFIATLIAIPLALFASWLGWLVPYTLIAAALIYTVPSLALITLLWPVFGLSELTVIVALSLYALLEVLRNTIAGLQSVSKQVLVVAKAMGYSRAGSLVRIALPIAMPAVISGIRLATLSTIGLVMIGALVGHGGLGSIVLNGFTSNFYRAPIVAGVVLTVLLGLTSEYLLNLLQRVLTPWAAK